MRRIRRAAAALVILASFALAWGVPAASVPSFTAGVHPYQLCPGAPTPC